MRRAAGVGLAWLALACSDIELNAPRIAGESYALVVLAEGHTPRVWIGDTQAEGLAVSFPSAETEATLDLVLLGYDRRSSSLALPTGWIQLAGPGAGRPLPLPQRALISSLRDGAQSPWQETNELPPGSVSTLRIDAPELPPSCSAAPVGESLALPDTEGADPTCAVGLPNGQVLIGVEGSPGRFFLVDRGGVQPLTMSSSNAPQSDAFLASDGRVWLIGGDGRYASWQAESGLSPIRSSGISFGRRAWLTGSRDGAPFELYAYGANGLLALYDGQSWRVVAQRDAGGVSDSRQGSLAWISHDHVVAVGTGLSTVLRFRNGAGVEEVIAQEEDALSSLLEHPQRGLYVGTRLGHLWHQQDGQWIAQRSSGLPIEQLSSFGCSVLYGGSSGTLVELDEGGSSCAPFAAVPHDMAALVHAGDQIAAVSSNGGNTDPVQVQFLTPASAGPSCTP